MNNHVPCQVRGKETKLEAIKAYGLSTLPRGLIQIMSNLKPRRSKHGVRLTRKNSMKMNIFSLS
jgi:hypothetical protein